LRIRENNKDDICKLVNLWYGVSLEAHNFIDKEYWKKAKTDMKEKYIPSSETYILENNNELYGFISMIENYLAAIFVDYKFQSQGFGKKLLDYVKKDRDYIELKVFKKNNRAYNFYAKNGFKIKEKLIDKNLKEEEYLMIWNKKQ
jgi:putative acetyltransferase